MTSSSPTVESLLTHEWKPTLVIRNAMGDAVTMAFVNSELSRLEKLGLAERESRGQNNSKPHWRLKSKQQESAVVQLLQLLVAFEKEHKDLDGCADHLAAFAHKWSLRERAGAGAGAGASVKPETKRQSQQNAYTRTVLPSGVECFTCTLCRRSTTDLAGMEQHFKGKDHAKAVQRFGS